MIRLIVPIILLMSLLLFPWFVTYGLALVLMFFSLGILPLFVVCFIVWSVSFPGAWIYIAAGVVFFFISTTVRSRLFTVS